MMTTKTLLIPNAGLQLRLIITGILVILARNITSSMVLMPLIYMNNQRPILLSRTGGGGFFILQKLNNFVAQNLIIDTPLDKPIPSTWRPGLSLPKMGPNAFDVQNSNLVTVRNVEFRVVGIAVKISDP